MWFLGVSPGSELEDTKEKVSQCKRTSEERREQGKCLGSQEGRALWALRGSEDGAIRWCFTSVSLSHNSALEPAFCLTFSSSQTFKKQQEIVI